MLVNPGRYQRQIQLAGFGLHNQVKLAKAKVLIVGVGGLGCAVAQYLCAAGIGQLCLVDGDIIELTNLHRQILFCEADIGDHKAQVAGEKLLQQNSEVVVQTVSQHLDTQLAEQLIPSSTVILDCTDNFQTRYIINDVAHRHKKVWIYASVLGFEGQLGRFDTRVSCFRCLYPSADDVPNCNDAGVLGVLPGIVGSLQAWLAIQEVCNMRVADQTPQNTLYRFGAQDLRLQPIELKRSLTCSVCGEPSCTYLDADSSKSITKTIDIKIKHSESCISVTQLDRLRQDRKICVIDVRTPQEFQAENVGGLNIPLAELETWNGFDPDTVYLLLCRSGVRSAQAFQMLVKKNGAFAQFGYYLAGGISALNDDERAKWLDNSSFS